MRNWGGTVTYTAGDVARPGSFDELAALLDRSDRVRVAGTRHTFSDVTDAVTMVDISAIGERYEVDRPGMTVTIDGAMTYGRLVELLAADGLGLHNLASLTPLSVAGAVSTATHGSGDVNGCLSTAVVGIEIMTAAGEIITRRRGEADFDGLVVSVGMAGVVLALTLAVEPAYEVGQTVYVDMELGELGGALDEVMGSGDSVSVFTRWQGVADQIWVKRRSGAIHEDAPLAGVAAAAGPVHPLRGQDPAACTDQLGRIGPWAERLPHFRAGALPSAGEEIQSEYFVPRSVGADALAAIAAIGVELDDVLLTSELRTVGADTFWLSPFAGRDSLALHFTWRPDLVGVRRAVARVESALAPFAPRPHWGKLFTPGATTNHPAPRRAEAVALFADLDPRGVFANGWAHAEQLRQAAPL